MNAIVLYDSQFGNTKMIAEAIHETINSKMPSELVNLTTANPKTFEMPNLVILGAPTQKFNAKETTIKFLNELPDMVFENKKVAAFDTRISLQHLKNRFLRFMVKLGGYAAKKIDKKMVKKGGTTIIDPEGFYVKDTEGPLLEAEIRRARDWGHRILENVSD
ncbi:MAG: flavodoxin family protein [Bacteroidota bacterium]